MLEAIKRLSTSKFHCGQNDREWKADIGWLIRNSENVAKALECDLPGEGKVAAKTDPAALNDYRKYQAGEISMAEFHRRQALRERKAA